MPHFGADGRLTQAEFEQVVRTATKVVAAYNASDACKGLADYVCDGVADDVQINAAIDALTSSGGSVCLSRGTFVISSSIILKRRVRLYGASREATAIQLVNSANTNLLTANLTNIQDVAIERLRLEGNRANNTSGIGLLGTGITYLTLRDVEINSFYDEGLYGLCSAGRTPYNTGWWVLDNVIIRYCGQHTVAGLKYAFYTNGLYGVFVNMLDSSYNYGAGFYGGSLYECQFKTVILDQNDQITAETGMDFSGGERISIIGGYIAENKYGISFNGTRKFQVIGVNLYQNTEKGIFITGSARDGIVLGNTLEGTAIYGYGIDIGGTAYDLLIKDNTLTNYTATPSNAIRNGSSGANIKIRDNKGYVASGDTFSISKTIDHASLTDGGDATAYMDFGDAIPAGSIIEAIKCDFVEAFNSDDTTTLTMMIGYVGALDAFNKTADPGENAFNHTTDVYWGESACQDPVVVTAKTPRVTFTEDDDGTDIINSANAQGGVIITITYTKA